MSHNSAVPSASSRIRWILVAGLLFIGLPWFATFYTDWLWFGGFGLSLATATPEPLNPEPEPPNLNPRTP